MIKKIQGTGGWVLLHHEPGHGSKPVESASQVHATEEREKHIRRRASSLKACAIGKMHHDLGGSRDLWGRPQHERHQRKLGWGGLSGSVGGLGPCGMSPQRYSCGRDSQLGSDGRRSRPLDCPGVGVLDSLPSDRRWIGGKSVVFTKGYELMAQDFCGRVLCHPRLLFGLVRSGWRRGQDCP